MSVLYRPATLEDLEPAAKIVQAAITDLRSRHAVALPTGLSPPAFPNYMLDAAPDGVWAADKDGGLVGLGYSWMAEQFWFLSQLFVLPGTQQHGVGKSLLAQTLGMARHHGAENRALITFAYNTKATGLYARHGMFPRQPLYSLVAPSLAVAGNATGEAYDVSPISAWPDPAEWLARIDQDILGFRRDAHHRFLLGSVTLRAMRLEHAGMPVGYAYVSASGHIGPLSVAAHGDPQKALLAAIRCAVQANAGQVSMIVPGAADRLLGMALDLGFRVVEPLVLLSEKPFGRWQNYMPLDPGFM